MLIMLSQELRTGLKAEQAAQRQKKMPPTSHVAPEPLMLVK